MPEYTYVCEREHITTLYMRMSQKHPRRVPCEVCRQRAGRVYLPPHAIVFKPYVTEVGDGKPKTVRRSSDETAIEDKFGVAWVMDSDLKRMRDEMPNQKERVEKRALAALPDIRKDYEIADAEVRTYGREYQREQQDQDRQLRQQIDGD